MTNLDLTLSLGFVIRMERLRSIEAAQGTLPSQSPSSMEALPSPLSSRANPDFLPRCTRQPRVRFSVGENRMKSVNANKINRKSVEAEGPAVPPHRAENQNPKTGCGSE